MLTQADRERPSALDVVSALLITKATQLLIMYHSCLVISTSMGLCVTKEFPHHFFPMYFSNHSRFACMADNCIFGSFGPCGWRGSTSIRVGTPCALRAL